MCLMFLKYAHQHLGHIFIGVEVFTETTHIYMCIIRSYIPMPGHMRYYILEDYYIYIYSIEYSLFGHWVPLHKYWFERNKH